MAKKGYKKCFICGYFSPKDEMYLTAVGERLCEFCFIAQWEGICPNCEHENEGVVKNCEQCKWEFYSFP